MQMPEKFDNHEMEVFSSLDFPFSKELRDVKNESRPNLQIENTNQSLYAVLKYIRNELVHSKLKYGKFLLLDKYIVDFLGTTIDVDSFYPPENVAKLDKFITQLKRNGINESNLDSIIYYILKDFSIGAAESFVTGGLSTSPAFTLNNACTIISISKNQYDLMNAIYFMDRFDITNCLKYIRPNYSMVNSSSAFVNHFIRFSNIISYIPKINLEKTSGLEEIRSYLDLNSSRDTSASVLAVLEAFHLNPSNLETDILLIYLDALTDISPSQSLKLALEIKSRYDQNLQLSFNIVLKIIVTKILIKSYKQQVLLTRLHRSQILDESKLEVVFDSLSHFYLVNTHILDQDVTSRLHSIVSGSLTKEEERVRQDYPKYFQRLSEFNREIKELARDVLILKQASRSTISSQELLSSSVLNHSQ